MDAAAQPATAAAPAPEQRLQTTAASSPAPELYREFSIGVALTTALDELVRALSDLSPRVGVRSRLQVGVAAVHQVVGGLISPAIALMILSQVSAGGVNSTTLTRSGWAVLTPTRPPAAV